MSVNSSPLDEPAVADFISRLVRAGETNASIARQVSRGFDLDTTRDSIRRFRSRHDLHIPGTEPSYTSIRGDEAECRTRVSTDGDTDPDRMLRERGLDPEDWYIDSITVNEWEGMEASNTDPDTGLRYNNKATLYQTKFTAKRKQPYAGLMPPRTDGWTAPARYKQPSTEPQLVVICGDQHAPFHDKHLHDLFQQWLGYNLPDRGVVLGDLGDFPDISRHRQDPENQAFAQECLQSSYDVFRDYVRASLDTEWDYLIGNHDVRIRNYCIENAPRIYGLRTVDTDDSPGEAIHTMSHLMRLDELGVNLVDAHGSYEWGQVELSEHLAVRHGWLARKGSGATALATLNETGYSVIMGHTHRQSTVFKSQPEIDGEQRTTVAVEAGTMCRIDPRGTFDEKGRRFPNYDSGHADWQRGFCTAAIFSDGRFKVDLASYVNGTLLWRDQRYE